MNDKVVVPKWKELIRGDSTFQVTFDMLSDLTNPLHIAFSISKDMRRNVRYRYVFNIRKARFDFINLLCTLLSLKSTAIITAPFYPQKCLRPGSDAELFMS